MVIRERDGELWWNMQDEAKVDFKMHDNGRSMYEVLEDIWTEGFDETNGPLWKSRLVKADEEDKFVTPEIKRDYPHRYYLMTVPHHGLFGGQSSARCTTPMLQAINAVIDGEPMDKVAPFGEYVPNSAYAETESMFREKLLTDPERLEAVKEYCTKSSKKSYLLDYYPPPKVDKATSKHCYIDFDLQTMKKFIANAKKNGITYGNAVQNVTTTAYVEMLQEAGATNDVFDISVGMAADTYRYLEKRDLPILGLHIKQMASYMSLSRNPREKFWEHCHVLQKLNKELIKSGYAFEQDVISDLFIPRVPTCEVFKLKPVTRDFGFTSIGNMDYVINGEGKHVQITHIVSFTSVHDYIFPFFQQIFTFRANEVNMMYYDSARISDDTMNHLIDRSLSVIAQYSK
ncbi:hypothetical protein SK128_007094 [Halocaridina rubra]|uniref:Uncharacterized protein n=1 Tax=Halocaridina rubra TaxID=373956 RepID=A0AAN9AAU5_HALRR